MSSARILFLGGTLVSLLVFGAGCSSFRRDSKAARATAPAAGSIEGLWEGRWYSAKNPDHGGKMQMVLTRTGDTLYRASSRSHWWKVFRSAYDTQLVLTPVRPGEFLLSGGKSLWAMGDYSLTGRVDAARFDAGYWVGSNEGRIELHRPGAEPAK